MLKYPGHIPHGQQVQRPRDRPGDRQRRLRARLRNRAVQRAHPGGRIGLRDGNVQPLQGDLVAPVGIRPGPQADRHQGPQGAGGHVVALVVPAQASGDGRQVGVVDGPVDGLGRPLQRVQGDLHHGEMPGHRPLPHEGGQGAAVRRGRPVDRPGHRHGVAGLAEGVARGADHGGDRRLGLAPGQQRGAPGDRADGAGDQGEQVRRLGRRHGRQLTKLGGFALPVGHQPEHAHGPDAVGQGMVELDDERRLAAVDALDQGDFPQRAGPVEGGHRRPARERQYRVPGAWRGSGDPAQVPVQVEMRIVAPPGDGEAERGLDDALAERGHQPGYPVDALDEHVPVWCAVEPGDDDDCRAERGVAFHVPGERVARPHVLHAGRLHLPDRRTVSGARAGPLVPGGPACGTASAARRSQPAPLPTVREGPVLERAAADRGVQDLGGVRDRDVLTAPGQGGCDLQ